MRPLITLFACGIAGLSIGCFGPSMTVDGRTALEQELTRLAIQGAIRNLPIHAPNTNSSGEYPHTLDRKSRVWSSANREREDGGVRVAIIREDVT